MPSDDFYAKKSCDRCHEPLTVKIMSWFTEEAICMKCSDDERKLREKLPNFGRDYEGCGYIPRSSTCTK